jgi:site-specific DNA-methyltransferase (adenine-specific)/modification methylase
MLSKSKGSDSWNMIFGDSRREIKKIPDGSIDFICTDPPYNLGQYSTGNIRLDWRADFNNDLAAWDQETLDPLEWKNDFLRILSPKGNIFIFTSYNLIGKWHEVFDPLFDTFQFMVWHKTNPAPKFRRAGFLNSCELIVCLWNKGHTWNFTKQNEMHNFIESPICMGKERLKKPKHPTQKPVKIMKKLIEIASNEGDTILDPFSGVGSTGIAALELNRKFIGIESDEEYFQASCIRLDQKYRELQESSNL